MNRVSEIMDFRIHNLSKRRMAHGPHSLWIEIAILWNRCRIADAIRHCSEYVIHGLEDTSYAVVMECWLQVISPK